jgi:hypothetical protein
MSPVRTRAVLALMVLAAVEHVLPAARIFLGVADHGYAWRPHSNDNLGVHGIAVWSLGTGDPIVVGRTG